MSRLFAILLCVFSATCVSEDAPSNSTLNNEAPLDHSIEELKKATLALNRDLFLLEEELLFPSSTQVSVFLSLDLGELFSLDTVKLEFDGKEVSAHLYTQREIDALARGGVQRLHIGNLTSGDHELTAFFTGKGPRGRDFKRGTTTRFKKSLGPKYIELKIVDDTTSQQPEFIVKEW